jgi:LEA14-like dessication related protein
MRQFLIALTAIVFLASCGNMKKPELVGVEDVKIRLDKVAAGQAGVIVYMRFFNPNSFTARLKHAEGEAWIDSSYIGHFVVDSSLKVGPKSDFVVPVNLSMKLKDVALGSLSLYGRKEKEVLIKIIGTVKAGRGGVYKNIPLNYEGKHDMEKLFIKKE